MVVSRSNSARWKKNEQAWVEFLKGIGGYEKLNFAWTRQSGRPWSSSFSSENMKRNKLRLLIREGV